MRRKQLKQQDKQEPANEAGKNSLRGAAFLEKGCPGIDPKSGSEILDLDPKSEIPNSESELESEREQPGFSAFDQALERKKLSWD